MDFKIIFLDNSLDKEGVLYKIQIIQKTSKNADKSMPGDYLNG